MQMLSCQSLVWMPRRDGKEGGGVCPGHPVPMVIVLSLFVCCVCAYVCFCKRFASLL
jgi:hypothetical protein